MQHGILTLNLKELTCLLKFQSNWKTLFPDYMWAHLAIGWDCNLDKYGNNSSKEEKQLVLDYLKSNRQNVFN